jgi:heme-degrading monooxygenase HmoA
MSEPASPVTLLEQPPTPAAIARMAAIDGVRIGPAVLNVQDGPAAHLGPEAAEAILILQATIADEAGFEDFWMEAAAAMELLATAPGFIRRYNFADGPHYTLVALWHTKADADAFYARDEHQAAIRRLFDHRWQYSHFAGLWTKETRRHRLIFCRYCDGVTPLNECRCTSCGVTLWDPFDPCGAGHGR